MSLDFHTHYRISSQRSFYHRFLYALFYCWEIISISIPYTYMRYKTKNKGDEDKVSGALAKLMDEDLTLKAVNDVENRQSLLYGIGEQQLEVVVSKLFSRYKVEIELSRPKVAFRETPETLSSSPLFFVLYLI